MPRFFTKNMITEKRKTYVLEPFRQTDGEYVSDHACLIPHGDAAFVGRCNRASMEIGGLIVPANVYHYINPDYHKPYGRWMPPFSLIKHVLTGAYTEEDKALPGNTNGFISYVTKKGVNRNGISDDLGIRSGSDYPVSDTTLHGRIVATGGTDSNVHAYEPAYVQTEAFGPLCREVAQRLIALTIVESNNRVEETFEECLPGVDFHNMIASYRGGIVVFKEPEQNILDLMEAYKTALLTGQYQSPEITRTRGTGEWINRERSTANEAEEREATYCSSDDEIAQREAKGLCACSLM